MMTDTTNVPGNITQENVPIIKKELDGFAECSPSNSDMYSPSTTTVINESGIKSSEVSCRCL